MHIQVRLCLFVGVYSLLTSKGTDLWWTVRTHGDFYGADTDETNPCPIIVVMSVRFSSDQYQFCKSLIWLCQGSNLRFQILSYQAKNHIDRESSLRQEV